jgi:hypothetical protein
MRMFEGNATVVGVTGRTLILGCGERPLLRELGLWMVDVSIEFEDTEDAFECVAP